MYIPSRYYEVYLAFNFTTLLFSITYRITILAWVRNENMKIYQLGSEKHNRMGNLVTIRI